MKGILLLQNQYLIETNEATKNQILSELYIELIKLGKFILQLKQFKNEVDDIYDLASNVCMRLMEKQQPIIKSAPSQYVSNALYYMNKSKFHDSLDSDDIEEPFEESFESKVVESFEYDELLSELFEIVKKETNDDVLAAEIIDCISSNTNYRKYSKEIDKDHKKEFNRILSIIRTYLSSEAADEWA